ncbi:hypothetical protein HN803_01140 [candidate division WWE3 bacterium]|jgi:hypothetical protein|nr:hypothetical protein [candidate division WWE3 bacterium]MBT7349378.1 hypothetical protein [candidate division WWE3 bacterium]
MKSVYTFGPIYISGQNYLPIYKKLNELCEKYFDKVISTYPDFWDSKETPREFWDRTYETITECDLFIAECSSPSHGVGMELMMGKEHNIPVLVLIRDDIEGFDKSTMVLGLPNLKKLIKYKNENDLIQKVEKELELLH